MLYFSSLLQTDPAYRADAARLFAALEAQGVPYALLDSARDIWLRDFMPVRTRSGRWVSFRYAPSYLKGYPRLRTDFRREIAPQLALPAVKYSGIALDGGNVVFSPARRRVILSDRVFAENPKQQREALLRRLETLLEAEVILIPSLKSDLTGHADGMVRFVDENTVVGNAVPGKRNLEQRIKAALTQRGIHVVELPFYPSRGLSAAGCYLNYLDASSGIFLPVFGTDMDAAAIDAARQLFPKAVVPVEIPAIAAAGGCLNCISWEA